MKLNLLGKFNLKWIILLLVLVNAALLFFLFKPNHNAIVNAPNLGENYSEINQIKGSNWDFQKLADFFKILATQKGGEYAYHALAQAANEGYLTSNVDTHLLGHVVGDILYKQKGIDGIKVCTQDLRNACSHSIVVGFLLEHGIDSISTAVATCHEAPGGSGAYTMCVHGLGHGVLAYTDYDMRKAVEFCDKTGTPAYHDHEVAECVGGVTMEMMSGVHDHTAWLKQTANYFKADDPLAPCDSGFIPLDSLSYCYTYLTPHLFIAAGADLGFPDPKFFPKAMAYCQKLPVNDPNRTTCLASFGKEYVVLANSRNIESVSNMNKEQLLTIYDWCKLGPTEALQPCLNSSLQSLYWGGENDSGVSVRFCTVIPDKVQADFCMNSLISAVSYYMGNNGTYKESFCKEIPDEYEGECRNKLLSQV